ncbi:MAG: family 1 glycosylhydrolase [Clostridiales bacterium]|nr:family 1 glycosylhydrolase [Clostridiales bacterium]
MAFPEGFRWGTASSAYQIEGAISEDGKGRCIWDDFAHAPGNILNDENGDVAADGYHRVGEDLPLLSDLGVDCYRFSLHWARALPDGRGRPNPKGFDFYDRLVDGLLERGIEPFPTLHHWELPSKLQDGGGWLNRNTADAFREFAALCAKRFDGRVKRWFTINEPQCIVGLGHARGIHAPGLKLPNEEQAVVMHNLLIAHGMAVSALRENSKTPIEVGACSTGRVCCPSEDTQENRDAAYEEMFRSREDDWHFLHSWFLDAAVFGHYPEDAPGFLRRFADSVAPEDMRIGCQKLDFLGLNIYNGNEVDASGNYVRRYPGHPMTALRWPVSEKALRYGPLFIWRRYGLPIYIAENGQSCNDRIFLDGGVHDPDRIDFLRRYLMELERAIGEGAPVRGYFHWSFTDNFEWHTGYADRFGLIYIDYRDLRRIPKDSAAFYREVARTNGRSLEIAR